jgi:hypothetical protein
MSAGAKNIRSEELLLRQQVQGLGLTLWDVRTLCCGE